MKNPALFKVSQLVALIGLAFAAPLAAQQMPGRDAPLFEEPKRETRPANGQSLFYAVPAFPAPSSLELFEKSLSARADQELLSFGRQPARFGIDSRITVPSGTRTAVITVTSTHALHMRTAWLFNDDARYTVTVKNATAPMKELVTETATGESGPQVVWSAITAGSAQEVTITRDGDEAAWTFSLDRVAHFDTPIGEDRFAVTPKIGEAAFCQSDIACLLDTLSPTDEEKHLAVTRAVAKMVLTTRSGASGTCTGTLLNSARFPTPYFLTADHCMNDVVTFDTFWFYARAACGFGPVGAVEQRTGGGRTVWRSSVFDSALIELTQAPPANASYAGWSAATVPPNESILAVHHPMGDLKKGSLGVMWGTNNTPQVIGAATHGAGTLYGVNWYSGIVEPGSSGSGFFTRDRAGVLRLQGTLIGGFAQCGLRGATWYARFDRIYPNIQQQLSSNPPPPPPPPPPRPPGSPVAIEYYHAAYGHYFVTSESHEIQLLDAGHFAGWSRTGEAFPVYWLNTPGTVNVCRFFSGDSFLPKSSHFYTGFADECEAVKRNPTWLYEQLTHAMHIPTPAGACTVPNTVPLYRLYNNGQGGAPNHRYTTSNRIRVDMMLRGWSPEGFGRLLGVVGCVPASH